MMTVQEIEERDFDPQPEALNCLREARMAMPASDVIPDDGRFHLVAEITHYCRATDAIAGTYKVLVSSHDTREEAEAAENPYEGDDEVLVSVHPIEPMFFVPEAPEDDLPF